MDAEDAPSAEMRQPPRLRPGADPLALDDAAVEGLLSGTLDAADAPPGYAGVAELLAATAAPPSARELAGQAAVLAQLRAVTRSRRPAVPAGLARPPRRRRRAGLAVVLVAGALAVGGTAAAATGHLPEPVRRILAAPGGPATPRPPEPAPVAGPAGSGGADRAGSPSTAATGHAAGAGAGSGHGPNLAGLCQAYLSGNGGEQGGKLDATAFRILARAAGGTDQTLAFCQRLQAAEAKRLKDLKRQDPPGDGSQGQGAPPATTGGGQGNGQGQGSPPPDPSSPPPQR